MNVVKQNGYVYYFDDTSSLKKYLVGKWMYFFNDKEFASRICIKAISEKVVVEAKHSDSDEGVSCFYINITDLEAHKKVISFFLKNQLIKHTKQGRLYNISFKLDSETHNGQYAFLNNLDPSLKLEDFVDLNTEQWILNKETFHLLLPLECSLLDISDGIVLDKEQFGADNASDYIHKAFPSYIYSNYSVDNNTIHFWKGQIPKIVTESNLFYIVRFQAVFYLKKGKDPFVINKSSLLYPFRKPLSTSDVYHHKDGKYYTHYISIDGIRTKSFPEFTLTKEDFNLFLETYDVEEIQIKDGCFLQ